MTDPKNWVKDRKTKQRGKRRGFKRETPGGPASLENCTQGYRYRWRPGKKKKKGLWLSGCGEKKKNKPPRVLG